MRRFLLPRASAYLLTAALTLAALVVGGRPAPLLAAFWVFTLAVAVPLVAGRPMRLRAGVAVSPTEASVGDTVVATLTVESNGWVPLIVAGLPVEPAFQPQARHPLVAQAHPGKPARLRMPLTASRRGLHAGWTPVGVAVGLDGLSAYPLSEAVPLEGQGVACRVRPRVVPIGRWAPLRSRPFTLVGDFTAPAAGRGLEFAGVRPFAAGDLPRQVHWRSSLRRDDVMVTERLRECHATFVVMVDALVDEPLGGASTLELTVQAAASVAEWLLRMRHRVGILVYGGTLGWLKPGSGARQWRRAIDHLAGVCPSFSYVALSLDALPDSVLPRESAVVAVSPLLDPRAEAALAGLRRRGHPVALILLDSVERLQDWAAGSAERRVALQLWRLEQQVALRRLRKAGVRWVEWDGRPPLGPVVAGLSRGARTGGRPAWPT